MIDLFRWLLRWWSPRLKTLRILAESSGDWSEDDLCSLVRNEGWEGTHEAFHDVLMQLKADGLVTVHMPINQAGWDCSRPPFYKITEAGRAIAVLL